MSIQRSNVIIEGMTIGRQAQGFQGGGGVVIGGGPRTVSGVVMRDCIVRWTTDYALNIGAAAQGVFVERCVFANNAASGLVLLGPGCKDINFTECTFDFFVGTAVELRGCQNVSIVGGNIESASLASSMAPYLAATDAVDCHLRHVWFEEPGNATATPWFVDLGRGCHGWTMIGCYFVRKNNVDGTVKLMRLGACSGESAGPVVGVTVLNPFAHTNYTAEGLPGQIEINDSSSEVCVLGGMIEGGFPGPNDPGRYPVNIRDATSKSTWIGWRQSRPPLVGVSETPNTGRLGDLLARPGRGLEMWNALTASPSWLPASVNRYANEPALAEIPATSKNRGTLVWIDAPATGTTNLRVWDGSAWRQVLYA
jgi:hypothetical protein